MTVILGSVFVGVCAFNPSNVIFIGGVLIRIGYDTAATIISVYNETYVPIVSSKAFINWWQETFTLVIPLSFLLSYIIVKAVKGKADK